MNIESTTKVAVGKPDITLSCLFINGTEFIVKRLPPFIAMMKRGEVVVVGGVVAVNSKLFQLFFKRKGLLFALMGIGYHQFYYLYSRVGIMRCNLESKEKHFNTLVYI